tara:strand:- start:1068 stop:1235 length:168 start_codon:yes stop_codon:yes gene_type:complete
MVPDEELDAPRQAQGVQQYVQRVARRALLEDRLVSPRPNDSIRSRAASRASWQLG